MMIILDIFDVESFADSSFKDCFCGVIDVHLSFFNNGIQFFLPLGFVNFLDAVYIVLGMNGLVRSEAMHRPRAEYCKIVISEAKVLIDAMKRDFPNVKVKIVSPYPPSVTGGCGFSYGAQPPYADRFDLLHYLFELNIAYQAWANEERYRDFVEFVGGTGQFDAEHNYPVMEKPVNTRSTVTETIATNGLHPTVNGYYQFGDAIFRNIVKEFCSK